MNNKIKFALYPLIAAVGLLGGMVVSNVTQSSKTITIRQTAPSGYTQGGGSAAAHPLAFTSAPRWRGLQEASPAFLLTVFKTPVSNQYGKSVAVPQNKPIFFSAPWCPYCNLTEHLLISAGLMSKFTILGVALTGSELGQVPARPANTVAQARKTFQLDWKHYGTHWPTRNILYALPSNPINKVIQAFPTLLIPHAGKWYLQVGYNPSASYWKSLVG